MCSSDLTISVTSTPLKGTKFEIKLPRVQLAEEVMQVGGIEELEATERRIEKCYIEFSDIYVK